MKVCCALRYIRTGLPFHKKGMIGGEAMYEELIVQRPEEF